MSSVLTVQAGFVSPPIPVNQYSVVQVAPNASPGSVLVLYSQDTDTYVRAGTASWTAWPNGSVTSSSAMMSNAKMFIQVSAQSSAATVSVGDPTPGQQEIVQSPWAGAEAAAMVFSSTVTFQTQARFADGSSSSPSISFTSQPTNGFANNNTQVIGISQGVPIFQIDTNGSVGLAINQTRPLSWGSSGISAPDVFIFRDGADILAMRHAISSQTFRVYGKFSASSTFAAFSHNGTNTVVSTQGGGISLSASTMGFFTVSATTQPNVSSVVTTTAGTSTVPFGFATAQQFQDTVNAVNALQSAMKQLGLSA